MNEAGTFTIFQYNGKDLFLKGFGDHFVVLSKCELTQAFIDKIIVGREVIIHLDGQIEASLTPEEIEEDRAKKLRHANVLRDIAAMEAHAEHNTLLPYQENKLKALYVELALYESLDPTATTLEQKRANESCERDKK